MENAYNFQRETIVKMVLIETETFFCYAIISKYGHVGLYDGNLNFLTSYHAIMTREDITRKNQDRRRRNRWITDAVFCVDALMFLITNTTRSIMIYDASGLKHMPLWLVMGFPNVVNVSKQTVDVTESSICTYLLDSKTVRCIRFSNVLNSL